MIRRTSDYACFGGRPCEEASLVKGKVFYVDQRTFKSVDEFNSRIPDYDWLGRGCNHRVNDIGIARDLESYEKIYTIEISSLGQLLKLCEKYGNLIVSRKTGYKTGSKELPGIEIYDDYRE